MSKQKNFKKLKIKSFNLPSSINYYEYVLRSTDDNTKKNKTKKKKTMIKKRNDFTKTFKKNLNKISNKLSFS